MYVLEIEIYEHYYYANNVGDIYLYDKVHNWLKENNIKYEKNWPLHDVVELCFYNKEDAALFKLMWL